jgi:rhodanese-related sulfurtransferase
MFRDICIRHTLTFTEYYDKEVKVMLMSFDSIAAKEIENYLREGNARVIDLREPYQYKMGHIPTAINIPYEEFEYNKNRLSSEEEIILYCQRGGISLVLARDLSKEGYNVKSIYGGINAYRGYIEK